ncbi:MAG: hypothetical protein ACLPLP_05265 [Mycobacterium sp.]
MVPRWTAIDWRPLRAGFRDPGVLSPELAAEIMPVFAGPGFVDSVAAAGRAVRATVPESITLPGAAGLG